MTRSASRSVRLAAILVASIAGPPLHGDDTEPRVVDPPAAAGAFGVETSADGTGVIATWIESDGTTATIRMSRFDPGAGHDGDEDRAAWTDPFTVTERDDLFANWADRPSVRRLADGSLLSHDLRKIADGTYAYGVRLQRSTDDGATWSDLGWLHDDARAVEHGFASIVATPRGAVAVWLDGRDMPEQVADDHDHGHDHGHGGSMTLRAVAFDPTSMEAVGSPASTGLDARVCECCDTDLAWTSEGPVIVYRDRGPNEERDISIVRLVDGDWTMPMPVHRDDWRIEACPVNGPAIAATGRRVVVAWYTAATGDSEQPMPPRVLVSTSDDAGATFTEPAVVSESTVGRVDVTMLPGGDAIVSWVDLLEPSAGPLGDLGIGAARDLDGERGSLACRRLRRDGTLGPVSRIAGMHLGRRAGFPRLEVLPVDERSGLGPRLFAIWRDEDADRIRAVTLAPP